MKKAQSIAAMIDGYQSIHATLKPEQKRSYLKELVEAARPYSDEDVHKICERFRLGHVSECLKYPPTVPQWLQKAREILPAPIDYKNEKASQRTSELLPDLSWKPPSPEAKARVRAAHEKFHRDVVAMALKRDADREELEARAMEEQLRANKKFEAQARADLLASLK